MLNFISPGDRIVVENAAAAVTSGTPVVLGSKLIIPVTDGVEGGSYAAMTSGVFELPKAAVAVSQGATLYWNETNSVVTTDGVGNLFIGYAFASALAADSTVYTMIDDNPDDDQAANVAAISTANATDLASAEALANANKTAINEILVALKNAGVMKSDA